MSTDAPAPPVLVERDAMKFEYTRGGQRVALKVAAVRNAETGMVAGVMAVDLVAAACELEAGPASNALTTVLRSNPQLDQVPIHFNLWTIPSPLWSIPHPLWFIPSPLWTIQYQ